MGAEGAGITPANGLIAFADSSLNPQTGESDGIGVARPDGTGRRLLTRTVPRAGQPAWSPDGRRIALVLGSSVALVNADGSGLHRLTRPTMALDRAPVWSPDGRLAFLRTYGSKAALIAVSRDGSHQRRLTWVEQPDDAHPIWSRDGR